MNAARFQQNRAKVRAIFLFLSIFFVMPAVMPASDSSSSMLQTAYMMNMMRGGKGRHHLKADELIGLIDQNKSQISDYERDLVEFGSSGQDLYRNVEDSCRSSWAKLDHIDRLMNDPNHAGDLVALQQQRKVIEEQRRRAEGRLARIREMGGSQLSADKVRKRIASLRKQNDAYQDQLMTGGNSGVGPVGLAAMRGLAGENAYVMIEGANPTSIGQAISAGFTYRAMSVVGKKLEQTLNEEGGQIWDTVIGGSLRSIKNVVVNGWYWLFHGGQRPFSANQLELWKTEVLSVILLDLDKRARESLKEQSSGRDSQMRSLFDATGETPNDVQIIEMARETDPTWQRIAQGYAQDLERLAMRIEAYKPFYAPKTDLEEQRFYLSEKSDIIALATRLQETLRLIRENILLPSATLKDLASGDAKLFLPQLAKELKERFDLLISTVQSHHGQSSKQGTSKNTSSSNSSLYASSRRNAGYGSAGGYDAGYGA